MGYDPGEARDEKGMWTDGGGGAAAKKLPGVLGATARVAQEQLRRAPASSLFAKYASDSPTDTAGQVAAGAAIAKSVPGAEAALAAAREKLDLPTSVPTNLAATEGGHLGPDGNWTPERAALHQTLLKELYTPQAIAAAKPPAGEMPTVTVLGGRGGSGKSWLTGPGGPVDGSKAITVDSDYFKAKLPGYQGWNAPLYQEESSYLVGAANEMGKAHGVNVVIDETLKSPGRAQQRIDQFGPGYKAEGFYMFASPAEATERAMGRLVSKGRFVPPEVIMSNVNNEKNFDEVIPQFKRWGVYSNMVKGQVPVRVAGGGKK